MTKKPLLNALAAAVYIVLIATFMFYIPHAVGRKDTLITPITVISLFTFSAAAMAYIFFYQPAQMYLDGSKKEALSLFVTSLMAFGVITIAFVVLLLVTSAP